MEEYKELTYKIIRCFYNVYNNLGYGFLEKVYENALRVELELHDFKVECQKPIKVSYKGFLVGDYYADMVVEDKIIK